METFIEIIGKILYYVGLLVVIVLSFVAIYVVFGIWFTIFCLGLVAIWIGVYLKDNY